MKERIVLDLKGNKARREIVKIQEYTRNGNFDCIVFKNVNQVPETWEDLKELCKELPNKIEDYEYNGINLIGISGLYFWQSGKITHNIYDDSVFVFAHNRTPQQMWQIIKGLIGE